MLRWRGQKCEGIGYLCLLVTRALFLCILNEMLPFLNVFTGQFVLKIVRRFLNFCRFYFFCPFYSYCFYSSRVPSCQDEHPYLILQEVIPLCKDSLSYRRSEGKLRTLSSEVASHLYRTVCSAAAHLKCQDSQSQNLVFIVTCQI